MLSARCCLGPRMPSPKAATFLPASRTRAASWPHPLRCWQAQCPHPPVSTLDQPKTQAPTHLLEGAGGPPLGHISLVAGVAGGGGQGGPHQAVGRQAAHQQVDHLVAAGGEGGWGGLGRHSTVASCPRPHQQVHHLVAARGRGVGRVGRGGRHSTVAGCPRRSPAGSHLGWAAGSAGQAERMSLSSPQPGLVVQLGAALGMKRGSHTAVGAGLVGARIDTSQSRRPCGHASHWEAQQAPRRQMGLSSNPPMQASGAEQRGGFHEMLAKFA